MAADGPAPHNDPADAEDRQFPDTDPVWHYGYLFAPALTLGGGTWAIQRNIVAEMALGLPREPDVQQGMSWAETQRQTR